MSEGIHLSQIDLISAIVKHLNKNGIDDVIHRHMNAVIKAATDIVTEFAKPEKQVEAEMGAEKWLDSDHTGLSSRFMCWTLTGKRQNIADEKYNYPHDPSDFGRCVGFLKAVPEARQHISRMVVTGKEWCGLAACWDELEALYNEEHPSGKAPKLYARMKELIGR